MMINNNNNNNDKIISCSCTNKQMLFLSVEDVCMSLKSYTIFPDNLGNSSDGLLEWCIRLSKGGMKDIGPNLTKSLLEIMQDCTI